MPSCFTVILRRRAALGVLLAAMIGACAKSGDETAIATERGVGALRGDTTEMDKRVQIEVSSATRFAVLTEMRTMLRAVQGIVAAASNQDTAEVRKAAATAGIAAASETDPTAQRELGSDFVMLGMRTHASFDSLAADVSTTKDQAVVLRRMAGVMGNCVGCHEQFRLVVRP